MHRQPIPAGRVVLHPQEGQPPILLTQTAYYTESYWGRPGSWHLEGLPLSQGGSVNMQIAERPQLCARWDPRAFPEAHRTKLLASLRNRMHSGTLGTDPEVFITVNGTVLPAWAFLPGKTAPLQGGAAPYNVPKPPLYSHSAYWDGVQAEARIEATTCLAYMTDYVRGGLKEILNAAKAIDPAAKLSPQSVVELPKGFFKGLPEEFSSLGCAPSLNAYDEEPLSVEEPAKLLLRFAGGHMHFGKLGLRTTKRLRQMVKALDAFVGVAGVSLAAGLDDPRRRLFYGRAGEYRAPAHGLEYRVLSNFWLLHPCVLHLVWELSRSVLELANNPLLCSMMPEEARVREIINSCNVDEARKLMEEQKDLYMAMMPPLLSEKPQMLWNLLTKGMLEFFEVSNLEDNWMLWDGAQPSFRVWLVHSHRTRATWNGFLTNSYPFGLRQRN